MYLDQVVECTDGCCGGRGAHEVANEGDPEGGRRSDSVLAKTKKTVTNSLIILPLDLIRPVKANKVIEISLFSYPDSLNSLAYSCWGSNMNESEYLSRTGIRSTLQHLRYQP